MIAASPAAHSLAAVAVAAVAAAAVSVLFPLLSLIALSARRLGAARRARFRLEWRPREATFGEHRSDPDWDPERFPWPGEPAPEDPAPGGPAERPPAWSAPAPSMPAPPPGMLPFHPLRVPPPDPPPRRGAVARTALAAEWLADWLAWWLWERWLFRTYARQAPRPRRAFSRRRRRR